MALIDNSPDIAEIMNMLGSSSTDIQTLATHPNINIWSKRKPVRDSRLTVPDAEIGSANNTWGLVPPGYSWGGNDDQVWTYNRPRGGASEPFRFQDFKGYNHSAQNPVLLPSAPTELNEIFTVMAIMPQSGDTTLGLSDFWQNMRLGLEVRNSSGIIDWASASGPTGSITVDLTGYLNTDTISVHFFITDVHKLWGEPSISHTKYSLPRKYPTENQHWLNIPVNQGSGDGSGGEEEYINLFQVIWSPITTELTTQLEMTNDPVYDLEVRIDPMLGGTGGLVYKIPAEIITPGSTVTHIITTQQLEESTRYRASLWKYPYGTNTWNKLDEYEFLTFGSMG